MKYIYKTVYETMPERTKEINALLLLGWEVVPQMCRGAKLVLRKEAV